MTQQIESEDTSPTWCEFITGGELYDYNVDFYPADSNHKAVLDFSGDVAKAVDALALVIYKTRKAWLDAHPSEAAQHSNVKLVFFSDANDSPIPSPDELYQVLKAAGYLPAEISGVHYQIPEEMPDI